MRFQAARAAARTSSNAQPSSSPRKLRRAPSTLTGEIATLASKGSRERRRNWNVPLTRTPSIRARPSGATVSLWSQWAAIGREKAAAKYTR